MWKSKKVDEGVTQTSHRSFAPGKTVIQISFAIRTDVFTRGVSFWDGIRLLSRTWDSS